MAEKLKKIFYKWFFFSAAAIIISLSVIVVFMIIFWVRYANGEDLLFYSVVFTVISGVVGPYSVYKLWDFFRDLKNVRKNDFLTITGTVVGFKKVEYGGDPPTKDLFPIVKNEEGNEVWLKIDNLHLNDNGTFMYLPHTRYAIKVDEPKTEES